MLVAQAASLVVIVIALVLVTSLKVVKKMPCLGEVVFKLLAVIWVAQYKVKCTALVNKWGLERWVLRQKAI